MARKGNGVRGFCQPNQMVRDTLLSQNQALLYLSAAGVLRAKQGTCEQEISRCAIARYGDLVQSRYSQQGFDIWVVGLGAERVPEKYEHIYLFFYYHRPELLVAAEWSRGTLKDRVIDCILYHASGGAGCE